MGWNGSTKTASPAPGRVSRSEVAECDTLESVADGLWQIVSACAIRRTTTDPHSYMGKREPHAISGSLIYRSL